MLNIGFIHFHTASRDEIYSMITDLKAESELRDTMETDNKNETVISLLSHDGPVMDVLENLCFISNDGEQSFCHQLETLFSKIFNAGVECGRRV